MVMYYKNMYLQFFYTESMHLCQLYSHTDAAMTNTNALLHLLIQFSFHKVYFLPNFHIKSLVCTTFNVQKLEISPESFLLTVIYVLFIYCRFINCETIEKYKTFSSRGSIKSHVNTPGWLHDLSLKNEIGKSSFGGCLNESWEKSTDRDNRCPTVVMTRKP